MKASSTSVQPGGAAGGIGGDGGDGGGDGGVGGDGGDEGGKSGGGWSSPAQMLKPLRSTELSLNQVNVSPAANTNPSGLFVPLKSTFSPRRHRAIRM